MTHRRDPLRVNPQAVLSASITIPASVPAPPISRTRSR